jgi:hypothetical protein
MGEKQRAANLTNSMRHSNVGFQIKNKELLKNRRGVQVDTAGAQHGVAQNNAVL